MDQLMKTSTQIEKEMLASIDEAYHDILVPVLRKHRRDLDRLDKLMKEGDMAQARALWRRSGIVDELAMAVADAGKVSAGAIRAGLTRIREAAKHDTG